jgi:hypothetical protein
MQTDFRKPSALLSSADNLHLVEIAACDLFPGGGHAIIVSPRNNISLNQGRRRRYPSV